MISLCFRKTRPVIYAITCATFLLSMMLLSLYVMQPVQAATDASFVLDGSGSPLTDDTGLKRDTQGTIRWRRVRTSYPVTTTVLDYLKSISGLKTISGQHNREPNSEPDKWTTWIYTVTGRYPGLWGGDFSYLKDDVKDENRWTMTKEAKEQWNSGTLVTFSWHVCPPHHGKDCGWEDGIKSDLTDEQWDDLLDEENGDFNKDWKRRIDEIVPYLEDLKKNEVEVLWRPLHEMNDDWCWWCGKKERTTKLYTITYEYMKYEKNLTNLIWVWNIKDITPTTTLSATIAEFSKYYPGDAYVDVVSLDPWYNGFTQVNYTALLTIAKDKPIAIGETCELPSARVLKSQPRWVWFLGWAELVKQCNTETQIRESYHDCRIVNRGLIKECSWLPVIAAQEPILN